VVLIYQSFCSFPKTLFSKNSLFQKLSFPKTLFSKNSLFQKLKKMFSQVGTYGTISHKNDSCGAETVCLRVRKLITYDEVKDIVNTCPEVTELCIDYRDVELESTSTIEALLVAMHGLQRVTIMGLKEIFRELVVKLRRVFSVGLYNTKISTSELKLLMEESEMRMLDLCDVEIYPSGVRTHNDVFYEMKTSVRDLRLSGVVDQNGVNNVSLWSLAQLVNNSPSLKSLTLENVAHSCSEFGWAEFFQTTHLEELNLQRYTSESSSRVIDHIADHARCKSITLSIDQNLFGILDIITKNTSINKLHLVGPAHRFILRELYIQAKLSCLAVLPVVFKPSRVPAIHGSMVINVNYTSSLVVLRTDKDDVIELL
jgi:hypothetical protein